MQVIYKYVTLLSIVLFFITKSHSQSLPISSYGVWDRGAGVVDYSSPNTDFIKGIEISANWDEVQPTGPTSWDFSLFQQKLDLAVANDKLIRFSINVGPDCPSWLFINDVPLVNVTIAPNSNQNYANRHPYYLDPEYKTFYYKLIEEFALFLRNQPQEKFDHIAFVQVKTGATGDEAPYKGTVNNPIYDISPENWQLFRLEAFNKFKLYFNDVTSRKIVLTFNNVDPTDEPEAYNYVMTVLDPVLGFGIKGGAYNRGHHLTDEQLYKEQWNPFLINPRVSTGNPNGRKLFSASEMDQSWTRGFFALNYEIGFYWSALGGINTGLSCTNISESAMTYALANPGIIDIFKMYNRYAQQVYPATATTAFSIFHEGLNSADTVKFPESIYGNANKSNLTRYQNICNDSKYANRGARLDDPNFVTLGQVTQRENQNFYNDAGWEICEGNIERFMTQINPDATSIGLFRVRGTITSTSSKYDRFARSFENSTGKNTMYFQLHNEVQATNKNLKFTIIWLDKTAGSTWAFKYRNSAGLQTIPFTGTGTNQWRTEIFNVIDGVMNQGGVNGSDFMLVNTDTVDDIFNGIEMNIIGDGMQSQTINFNPFPYKKMGDADFNPGATASSGLAITYTSSNTNVATIVNNMIHIVGLGVSTITASQAGNNGYNPAPSIAQDLSVVIETSITTSTSGTWTCPADVNTIQVEVWGGGGGGGGTYLAGFAGGGAGGSYVINNSVTVVPAASYNLTVGAGGAQSGTGINGVNGNPGGNTTFGSATPVIANGGIAGGATTTAGQLGSGGTNSTGGSGGTVTLGLPGASGANGSGGSGGAGAGALGGAGGVSKTSAGNGIEGTAPGGGGGGAYGPTTGSNRGSAGGAGQIIITYRVGAPNAPTIGTATVSGVNGQASISFTAPAFNGNSSITTYTATSSPGGITATVSQAGSGTMQVNGLTNGTVYTFTVRATNSIGQSVESAASNAVTPFTITAWDGAAWSNGTPTVSVDAIIAGNYSVAGNITAKTLTINNNAIVTIPSGYNVTVTGAVIVTAPATLTLSNNANLIQLNGITNTGAITVIKNSNALSRLDYTIWSSPVAEQNILAFSPATLSNRFYNYNETTNLFNVVASPSASPFATATGYLIRMPSDHPTTPTVWNGSFSGVPNNGTINKAITYNGSAPYGYNMIGNPYPSTIDADDFITINTSKIESSLYFWRKINSAPGSAYAVYNSLGATATPSSASPNGTIQVGQGFFVKAKSNSTISFTNAMRVANNDNQFFRTNQIQKDRIWLNLTNGSGVFSQTLIGYLEEGSQGEDSYDAKYINDSPIALTSNINNEEYTIQSRSTFDPADVVALNFKTTMTGDYTIAIDHFDGVFTTEQAIYLKDNTTGNETDLKAGSYTFAATAGIDNARFSLKYQRTLNVDAPEFNQNNVRVYINNGTLYVNSGTNVIKTIEVYDIQGRLIAQQKSVKATTATIHNLKATNQVLIVKIIDENSKVVIKKTVN
jgi:hypothetical protein